MAAPSAKQYTFKGAVPTAAPARSARSGCRTVQEKCGQTCTTAKACAKYGCNKEVAVKCTKLVSSKFDCHVTRTVDCKKRVYKTYACDKWSTEWVADGCEKRVTKKYGCHKEVKATCEKSRIVSVACDVKKQVPCKKQVPHKCTKQVAKQCFKVEKKSAACTKTYRKQVNCANGSSIDYNGKACYETIAYPSTCKTEVKTPFDCSYHTTYDCTKTVDATCEKTVKSLCQKAEKVGVPCTKKEWSHDGCSHEVTEKYGCHKSVKKAATCGYTEEVAAKCEEKKWVKGGCTKTEKRDALCKKNVWDGKCCAAHKDVKTCKDKFCPKKVCGYY